MDLTTIGFVGLGKMGTPMVRQLAAAGRRVVAFDLQADAVERVAAIDGVSAAESLAAVGAAAEVVITMLPNGSAVSAAVLGGDGGEGLVAGLRPGSVVIDMSSSAPWETVELGARLDALGIRLVDAPVSGGVARAITAELAIFAGGDAAVIDAIEPMLGDMGTSVFRTGPLSTGHTAKALNNLLSAACFAATIEVVKLAEAGGIDPRVMADVLNAATGKNNTTDRKLKQFVLSETFDSGFALALMVKDLKQSAELADRAGFQLPISRGVIDLWVEGADELPQDADHTEIAKVIRGSAE
jgi:3-hydroxyisobutyrate dehydrogenase